MSVRCKTWFEVNNQRRRRRWPIKPGKTEQKQGDIMYAICNDPQLITVIQKKWGPSEYKMHWAGFRDFNNWAKPQSLETLQKAERCLMHHILWDGIRRTYVRPRTKLDKKQIDEIGKCIIEIDKNGYYVDYVKRLGWLRKHMNRKTAELVRFTTPPVKKPDCDWCGNPVRNRYVTYILPDGTVKYTHGVERWFPEVYRDFGVKDTPYTITKGPKGEILDFRS